MPFKYNCANCGKEFMHKSSEKKYCSHYCFTKDRSRKPLVKTKCNYCGKDFYHTGYAERINCSKKCNHASQVGKVYCREGMKKGIATRIKSGNVNPGKTYFDKLGREIITGTPFMVSRVKAQKVIGRKLTNDEVVHHINGNPSDNRNENLLICDRSYHAWLHGTKRILKEVANGNNH